MKKMYASIAALMMCSAAMSQNARLNSLSESPVLELSDPSSVMSNPAKALRYDGLLQLDVNSSADSTLNYVLGAVPITPSLSIGGYVNTTMDYLVYNNGDLFGTFTGESVGKDYHPHLFAAYDMGSIQLGLDLYAGRISTSREDESSLNNRTIAAAETITETSKRTEEEKRRASDLGLKAGALLEITPSLDLELSVGLVKGRLLRTSDETADSTYRNTTSGASQYDSSYTENAETKLDEGSILDLGVIAQMEVGEGVGIFGASFKNTVDPQWTTTTRTKYNRITTIPDADNQTADSDTTIDVGSIPEYTTHDKVNVAQLGILAGYSREFADGLTIAVSDDFTMTRSTQNTSFDDTESDSWNRPEDTNIAENRQVTVNKSTTESLETELKHSFVFALEKRLEAKKVVDAQYFRLSSGINVTKTNIKSNGDTTVSTLDRTWDTADNEWDTNSDQVVNNKNDNTSKGDAVWGTPTIAAGYGLEKGRLALDLFIQGLNFDFSSQDGGILGLMPVAGATLTVDFGNKSAAATGAKESGFIVD